MHLRLEGQALFFAVSMVDDDDIVMEAGFAILGDEHAGDIDRCVEEAAGIEAQIEDQGAHMLSFQVGECGVHL